VLAAEHGLRELQVDDHLEVGPAGRPTRAPPPAAEGAAAEERLEHVADAAEPERVARRRAPVDAVGTEGVVAAPLLRIGQHLVGVSHLLEQRLRLGIAVAGVRMELPRELAEGALDLFLGGVAGDAQQLVVVGGHGFLFSPP
jgi:hypothetical protein